MSYLTGFSRLENLYVGSAEVDDRSVACLKKLRGLKQLVLVGEANISEAGKHELRMALPNCEVLP